MNIYVYVMYNVMRKTKSKKYNNVIAMIIIIHDNSIGTIKYTIQVIQRSVHINLSMSVQLM